MSPSSKRIIFALAFLLMLPAIATVYAPPAPHIGTPTISPATPSSNDQVSVNVTVTANAGVKNVTIYYSNDNFTRTNSTVVASYNSTSQRAIAHIPPQYNGGTVEYYIVVFDNNSNKAVNDNGGRYFSYTVPAPTGFSLTALTSNWIELVIVMVAIGAAVSVGFYALRHKKTTS